MESTPDQVPCLKSQTAPVFSDMGIRDLDFGEPTCHETHSWYESASSLRLFPSNADGFHRRGSPCAILWLRARDSLRWCWPAVGSGSSRASARIGSDAFS